MKLLKTSSNCLSQTVSCYGTCQQYSNIVPWLLSVVV